MSNLQMNIREQDKEKRQVSKIFPISARILLGITCTHRSISSSTFGSAEQNHPSTHKNISSRLTAKLRIWLMDHKHCSYMDPALERKKTLKNIDPAQLGGNSEEVPLTRLKAFEMRIRQFDQLRSLWWAPLLIISQFQSLNNKQQGSRRDNHCPQRSGFKGDVGVTFTYQAREFITQARTYALSCDRVIFKPMLAVAFVKVRGGIFDTFRHSWPQLAIFCAIVVRKTIFISV